MARNPEETVSLTMVDRSGEIARISVAPSAASVANVLDAAPLPTTAWGGFLAAIGSVADGAIIRTNYTQTRKHQNLAFATDGQREERWLVLYQDNTTLSLYSFEIPCRKAGIKPPPNQDEVDLTAAPWATFKTAVETAVVSPDGNGITVLAVRLIGRNI